MRGTRDAEERVCPWRGCRDQLCGFTAAREQLGNREQRAGRIPLLSPGFLAHSFPPSLLDKREPRQVTPGAQCPPCPPEVWGCLLMDGAGRGRILGEDPSTDGSLESGSRLGLLPKSASPHFHVHPHANRHIKHITSRGTCSSRGGGVCGSCGT